MTRQAKQIMADQPTEQPDELAGIDTEALPEVPAATEEQEEEAPKLKDGYVLLGKTKGGKYLQTCRDPKFGNWYVSFTSGGEIPPELSGQWSRMDMLKMAVENYLNK